MGLLALLCCLVIGCVGAASGGDVGGGGYALRFRTWPRRDLVAMTWRGAPTDADGLTIEFWWQMLDDNVEFQTVLGYAVEVPQDAATVVARTTELEIGFWKAGAWSYHNNIYAECTHDPRCTPVRGQWFHWAVAWNYTTGIVRYYLDGQYLYEQDRQTVASVRSGGVFHLGCSSYGVASNFDPATMMDGVLDELRIWGTCRTAADIAALRTHVQRGPAVDLALAWNFDDVRGGIVPDVSGHGLHGLVGALPTGLQGISIYQESDTIPTSPRVIVSRASPLFGSGIQPVWAPLRPGDATVPISIALRGATQGVFSGTLVILSVPVNGTLTTSDRSVSATVNTTAANGVLAFTPTRAPARGVPNNFSVSLAMAAGGSVFCDVHLLGAYVPLQSDGPVGDAVVSVSAASFVHLALGGVDDGGLVYNVSLLSLPNRGTLSSPAYKAIYDATYANMIPGGVPLQADLGSSSAATMHVNDIVGPAAVVSYTPTDASGGNDTFAYNLTAVAGLAARYEVAFDTIAASRPPTATAMVVTVGLGGDEPMVSVVLAGHDAAGERPQLFQITRGFDARLGGLFQVLPNGTLGAALTPAVARIVDQYGFAVHNESSQFSSCGCSQPFAAAAAGAAAAACADKACEMGDYSGWQALGVPDVFPNYGDSQQAWSCAQSGAGAEFLEVGFPSPVAVLAVIAYETYGAGNAVGISGRASSGLPWVSLWEDTSPLLRVPIVAVAFSPTLRCGRFAADELVSQIRLEFDSTRNPGYPEVDAVLLRGVTDTSYGPVHSHAGEVALIIAAGLHGVNATSPFATFDFVASDCAAQSSPATVTIVVPPPAVVESASVYRTWTVVLAAGGNSTLALDLNDAPGAASTPGDNVSTTLVAVERTDVTVVVAGVAMAPSDSFTGDVVTMRAGPTAPLSGRIHLWRRLGLVVVRCVAVIVPVCGLGGALDAGSGDCSPCANFSARVIAGMPLATLAVYRATCPLCPAGFRRSSAAEFGRSAIRCVPCARAYFRGGGTDDAACAPAPSGSVVSSDSSTFNLCIHGDFSWFAGNATCDSCPSNAVCLYGDRVAPLDGYWRSDPLSAVMHACLVPAACTFPGRAVALLAIPPLANASEALAAAQCAPGYSGVLCGTCAAGYVRSISGVCQECGSNALVTYTAPLIGLVVIGWVLFTIRESMSDAPRDAVDVETVRREGAVLKSMTSFVQCLGITAQLPISWPVSFGNLLSITGYLSASLGDLVGVTCFVIWGIPAVFQKAIVTIAVIPLAALVAVPLIWRCVFVWQGLPRVAWPGFAGRRLSLSYLVVTFLLWPSVCGRTLALFSCTTVDDTSATYATGVPARRYLADDTSIECYVGGHLIMVCALAAPSILLMCIGVPLKTYLYLTEKRAILNSPYVLSRFGFMYASYCKKRYYWETVVMLRKLSITAATMIFRGSSSSTQCGAILGILIVSLVLHLWARPIHDPMLAHAETVSLTILVAIFFWAEFLTFDDVNDVLRLTYSSFIIVLFSLTLAWFMYTVIRQTLLGYAARGLKDYDGELNDAAVHDLFLKRRFRNGCLRGAAAAVLAVFLRPDKVGAKADEVTDPDEGFALSQEIHVRNVRLKKVTASILAMRRIMPVMRISSRHLSVTREEPDEAAAPGRVSDDKGVGSGPSDAGPGGKSWTLRSATDPPRSGSQRTLAATHAAREKLEHSLQALSAAGSSSKLRGVAPDRVVHDVVG